MNYYLCTSGSNFPKLHNRIIIEFFKKIGKPDLFPSQ